MVENQNLGPNPLYTFRLHKSSPVTCLVFSPCNKYIASGDCDGLINYSQFSTRRPIYTFQPHKAGILNIFLSSTVMISHSRDDSILIHSIPNFTLLSRINVNSLNFCRAALRDNLVAFPSAKSELVDVYSLKSQSVISRSIGSPNVKTGLAMAIFLVSKDRILIAFESGHVGLYCIHTAELIGSLQKLHVQPVICMDVNNESTVVTGSAEDTIFRFGIDGSNVKSLVIPGIKGVGDIKWRSDGKIIVCACWDSSIRILSRGMKHLGHLAAHRQSVDCIALAHRNGNEQEDNLILAGSKDATFSLWQVY